MCPLAILLICCGISPLSAQTVNIGSLIEPGYQDGQAVKVVFMLPIRFRLE
ncbi:MAG: hypothetical protein AAFW73_24960 [Bacteroidota bacterium]